MELKLFRYNLSKICNIFTININRTCVEGLLRSEHGISTTILFGKFSRIMNSFGKVILKIQV